MRAGTRTRVEGRERRIGVFDRSGGLEEGGEVLGVVGGGGGGGGGEGGRMGGGGGRRRGEGACEEVGCGLEDGIGGGGGGLRLGLVGLVGCGGGREGGGMGGAVLLTCLFVGWWWLISRVGGWSRRGWFFGRGGWMGCWMGIGVLWCFASSISSSSSSSSSSTTTLWLLATFLFLTTPCGPFSLLLLLDPADSLALGAALAFSFVISLLFSPIHPRSPPFST